MAPAPPSGSATLTLSQLPYFLGTTVLMTLSPILVMLSQDEHGHLNYSIPSTTLITGVRPERSSVPSLARICWPCSRPRFCAPSTHGACPL